MATIVVAGGAGFIGREVVARLSGAGHRVIVPTRRRAHGRELWLLPTVEVVECDATDPASLARLTRGADVLVNLVGILHESRGATFERIHAQFPRDCVAACRAQRVGKLVHVSAINAAADAPSKYLRSKAAGEAAVREGGVTHTVFRPNVVFGANDRLSNLFVGLAGFMPVIALGGADATLQPVWVEDVAQAIAQAVQDERTDGATYTLCGPQVMTLAGLCRESLAVAERPRAVLPLPPSMATLMAGVLEHLPGQLMSRDNLASLSLPATCDAPFPAVFGIAPTPFASAAAAWLAPMRERDAFDTFRAEAGRD